MTTAKILAFAGSARRDSWNRKVLPSVAVPGVAKTFDESGVMTHERTRASLSKLGARVATTIAKLG